MNIVKKCVNNPQFVNQGNYQILIFDKLNDGSNVGLSIFLEGQDLYLTLWSMQALTLPCSNPIPSVWIAIMDDSGSCSVGSKIYILSTWKKTAKQFGQLKDWLVSGRWCCYNSLDTLIFKRQEKDVLKQEKEALIQERMV